MPLFMTQEHHKYREFRTPFSCRFISKNPRSMYARVARDSAIWSKNIAKLSHVIGTAPILEMGRAYGLRPRLWLLAKEKNIR